MLPRKFRTLSVYSKAGLHRGNKTDALYYPSDEKEASSSHLFGMRTYYHPVVKNIIFNAIPPPGEFVCIDETIQRS